MKGVIDNVSLNDITVTLKVIERARKCAICSINKCDRNCKDCELFVSNEDMLDAYDVIIAVLKHEVG